MPLWVHHYKKKEKTMADDVTTQVDNAVIPSPDKEDIAAERERWKGRRQMAWASLAGVFIVTFCLFYTVPIEKVDKLSDVVIWFYGTMLTVIAAYMGTTVAAHIFGRKVQ
jgi:hypothetical protein